MYKYFFLKMSVFGSSNTAHYLLSNLEIELQDFYWNVFTNINKKILSSEPHEETEIENVSAPTITSNSSVEFVLKWGTLNTSAISHNLLKLINHNPLVFQDALWQRSLRICCFGFALVAEIVAICKILNNAQECFFEATRRPLHVIVTIMYNNVRSRKTIIKEIFEELKKVLDPSMLSISYSFLKIDMKNPLSSAVKRTLEKTDVLMMVKLISSIKQQQLSKSDINFFLEKVISTLKIKSLIFFFDAGANKNLRLVKNAVSATSNIKCMHEPVELEPFMLSQESLDRYSDLQSEFTKPTCLTSQIINSCSWIKLESKDTDEVKFSLLTNQEWNKKKILCQTVLEEYRNENIDFLDWMTIHNFSDELLSNEEFEYRVLKDKMLFPTKEKSKRIWIQNLSKDLWFITQKSDVFYQSVLR